MDLKVVPLLGVPVGRRSVSYIWMETVADVIYSKIDSDKMNRYYINEVEVFEATIKRGFIVISANTGRVLGNDIERIHFFSMFGDNLEEKAHKRPDHSKPKTGVNLDFLFKLTKTSILTR